MIGCPDQDGDGWYNCRTPSPTATQWSDMDGDGYGDNASGNDADQCPEIAGTSTLDRLGCVDSDDDGYSDPDIMWTPAQGADAFMADPTQWSDQDSDFFGDNPAGESPMRVQPFAEPRSLTDLAVKTATGMEFDATDDWTLEQGADACPFAFETQAPIASVAWIPTATTTDPTPDWRAADGADAYH